MGAGTFLPVKDRDAAAHPMHTEHFEIRRSSAERLLEKWDNITAVGTTSVRTLESLTALAWRIRTSGAPDASRVIGQWELYDLPEVFTGREALQVLSDYMVREDRETQGRHADHDYAAGIPFPDRAQYRHELPPAQIDVAVVGVGLRGR